MTALPTISIVTPSYNQGAFLERTIRSVLEQDYPALEYRVMDGGSTDESVEIIRRYEDRLAEWVSEKDDGQADAIAKGFGRSTGEIQAWLNSDDVYLPGALRAVGEFFAAHPEVDFVYGDLLFIDPDDRPLVVDVLPEYSWEDLRRVCMIPQPASFWRRSAADRVGGIDPRFQFTMDYDFFLRFGEASERGEVGGIAHLPRLLAGFRWHAEAKSSSWRDVWGRENDELIRRYLGRPGWNRADWLRMKWLTARQMGLIAARQLRGERLPTLTPARWHRVARRRLGM